MLTLVAGEQRSGKTLYVVRRVIRLHDSQRPAAPIWSNIDIDHPKAVRLSWAELLDPELPAGYVVWDEAARAWDSRSSMSHTLSQLQGITEEGKNLRDVYLTAQDFGMLDVRLRRMCTRAVRIRGLLMTADKHHPHTDELLKRRHPRWISIEVGKWKFAEKPNKDNRKSRIVLPWSMFKSYTSRYDTAERVQLAGHLQQRKDHYRDQRAAPPLRVVPRAGSPAPVAARPSPSLSAPPNQAVAAQPSRNGARHAR